MSHSCHYKKSGIKTKKDLYSDDSDTAINSDDDFGDDEDIENVVSYNFPDFDTFIKNGLNELNENVFIKLNWSSPKDAFWCLNKLSCDCLRDVYMLLRSSDFMTHDLNIPFDKCDENSDDEKILALKSLKYYFVMRKWVDINPSGEFRCFVQDNKLVGNNFFNIYEKSQRAGTGSVGKVPKN